MSGEGRRTLRQFVEEYVLGPDQRLVVLGEGRLVNLAAAEGHPASVMDMSFANQALASAYLVREGRSLENRVYQVPEEIDKEIARLKLVAMGIEIDQLTSEQETYLTSWEGGT
jgi:adenosylhomocysteinase